MIVETGNVGIGIAPSVIFEIAEASSNTISRLSTYRTSNSLTNIFQLAKSGSNTIGTLSGTASDEVFGNIAFMGVNSGGSAFVNGASIIGEADGSVAGATFVSGRLVFYTGTNAAAQAERMRITSTGFLGYGTDTPSVLVEIGDADGADLSLLRMDSTIVSTNQIGQIFFKGNDPSSGAPHIGASINVLADGTWDTDDFPTAITFMADEAGTLTERVRIDSSGNVGIGTASPTANLEIARSAASSFTGITSWSTTNTEQGVLFFTKSAGTTIGTYAETVDGESLGSIQVFGSDSNNSLSGLAASINFEQDGSASATKVPTRMIFSTGTDSANATERVRIDSSGNVGIGTDSPAVVLHIVSTSSIITDSRYNMLVYDDTAMDAGVGGGIIFGGNHKADGSQTAFAAIWGQKATNTEAQIDGELHLGARKSGVEGLSSRLMIDNNGNVGIGTDSPGVQLDQFLASGSIVHRLTSDLLANSEAAANNFVGKKSGGASRTAAFGVFYNTASTSNEACGYILLPAGDGAANFLWVDDSDLLRISTSAGNIGQAAGTVVGDQTSDERLKTILPSFKYGLADVLKLKPIEYDLGGVHRIGFGAQHTQKILPEVVYDTGDDIFGDEENTKLAMRYVDIIPANTKAIQDLHAIIEFQAAKIKALEDV